MPIPGHRRSRTGDWQHRLQSCAVNQCSTFFFVSDETMPPASPFKLLSLCILGLTLSACSNQVDPNSPEGQRQAAFKQILGHSEPLGGMLLGRVAFDGEAFAAHAEGLVELIDAPWAHFPEPGESNQRNASRPEIWSDPEGFAAAIDAYKSAVNELAAVTREGVDSLDQVRQPLTAVQQACKACHDDYRR
ncbi:hypothetical protein BVH74_07095 [Halopseudomonas phragmitis]|uniref:Cytochrome c n=2 Tax=Halopseudomonas phragmitis TaxID=1931241 RepID=A0A1V0B3M1_9GAMM|nr:hypothetical protein BVH74_07095 [Halopseudomonas phragmitis]